jgi:hypothetical protein
LDVVLESWFSAEQLFDPVFDPRDLTIQTAQVCLDLAAQASQSNVFETILFSTVQAQQLVTAADQFGQLLLGRRAAGAERGLATLPEQGQDRRVQAVSFSQTALGASEVASLAGIDDADGHGRLLQGRDHPALIATGSFAHDVNGWPLTQPLQQTPMVTCVVGEAAELGLWRGQRAQIEMSFGNVEPDVDNGCGHG